MPGISLVVGLLTILLLTWSNGVATAKSDPQPLALAVNVRDYAGMPSWRWTAAQHEVERMFARLDLRISWTLYHTDALLPPPPGLPGVTVLILSAAMAEAKCQSDHLPDTTLGSSATRGGRAWVFYDRVERAGELAGVNIAMLLARTITHELGHLIAELPHSDYGIMRGDAELIPGGFQEFQAPQRRAMRDAVAHATNSRSPMLALRTPGAEVRHSGPDRSHTSRTPASREQGTGRPEPRLELMPTLETKGAQP